MYTRGPKSTISYLLCLCWGNIEIVAFQIDTNCEYTISVQVMYWCLITVCITCQKCTNWNNNMPSKSPRSSLPEWVPAIFTVIMGIMMNLWQDLEFSWWYDRLVANWKFFRKYWDCKGKFDVCTKVWYHVILYIIAKKNPTKLKMVCTCFSGRILKNIEMTYRCASFYCVANKTNG